MFVLIVSAYTFSLSSSRTLHSSTTLLQEICKLQENLAVTRGDLRSSLQPISRCVSNYKWIAKTLIQEKVESSPRSSGNIHGCTFSSRTRFGISHHRENRQTKLVDSEDVFKSDDSFIFFTHSRYDGLLHRDDIECSTSYETNTITSSQFLESYLHRYDNKDSIYSTSEIPSYMVDKFSEYAERPIFSITQNQYYNHNRCLQQWF